MEGEDRKHQGFGNEKGGDMKKKDDARLIAKKAKDHFGEGFN